MGCFHSKEGGTVYSEDSLEASPQLDPSAIKYIVSSNTEHLQVVRSAANSFSTPLNAATALLAQASSHKLGRSFVSADLNAIVDDQGTINSMVSRQLSMMSHYSVKSESGSVVLHPEDTPSGKGFTLHKLIGRGGFGNVYLGDWEGGRVAVKVVTGSTEQLDQQEDKDWEAKKEKMAQMEAILMASVNHPHIVHTFKVISHQGEAMDLEVAAMEKKCSSDEIPAFEWHIIMEYCDRGSLSRALASQRFHEPAEAGYVRWDAWASLETMKEVTKALIFLHENRILHGDLKAANVLLSSSAQDRRGFIAKVSDFGLSRVLAGTRTQIKTQTFGTVTHMPPELLSKGLLTGTADSYAMGVLLWETYSSDRVFKSLSDSEVILAVVTRKARPLFPSDTPPRYKYLAERCWSELPEVRPSLNQLYIELDNLQKALCPDGASSPRLTVQSCIKAKPRTPAPPPPLPVPKVQPMSRMASQGAPRISVEGKASPTSGGPSSPTHNSGHGVNKPGYVASPLQPASHAAQVNLKTLAMLNRTVGAAHRASLSGKTQYAVANSNTDATKSSDNNIVAYPGPPVVSSAGLAKASSQMVEGQFTVNASAASSPSLGPQTLSSTANPRTGSYLAQSSTAYGGSKTSTGSATSFNGAMSVNRTASGYGLANAWSGCSDPASPVTPQQGEPGLAKPTSHERVLLRVG